MDKIRLLDEEVKAKEQEYIDTYRRRDISIDTCNMLIEALKTYYDIKRSRILDEQ